MRVKETVEFFFINLFTLTIDPILIVWLKHI